MARPGQTTATPQCKGQPTSSSKLPRCPVGFPANFPCARMLNCYRRQGHRPSLVLRGYWRLFHLRIRAGRKGLHREGLEPLDGEGCRINDRVGILHSIFSIPGSQRLDRDMSTLIWYVVSKTLAERASLETMAKIGTKFSLANICPPSEAATMHLGVTDFAHSVIAGPAIHYANTTGDELANADVSTSNFYKALAGGKDAELIPTPFPAYADVSDTLCFYIGLTYFLNVTDEYSCLRCNFRCATSPKHCLLPSASRSADDLRSAMADITSRVSSTEPANSTQISLA